MNTPTAVIWSQIPIAIAIFICAYQLYKTRKYLAKILEKITKK